MESIKMQENQGIPFDLFEYCSYGSGGVKERLSHLQIQVPGLETGPSPQLLGLVRYLQPFRTYLIKCTQTWK